MPNKPDQSIQERLAVPRNQFRHEIHGYMSPDGYVEEKDYRCNYCDKLCYYGETFGHRCDDFMRHQHQLSVAKEHNHGE